MTEKPEDNAQYRSPDQVDPKLWDELTGADPARLAREKGALHRNGTYRLELLSELFEVIPAERLVVAPDAREVTFQEALVLLAYLTRPGQAALAGKRLPLHQLPGGQMFFTKQHRPATDFVAGLLKLDRERFAAIGDRFGARDTGQGDGSWLLWLLPQVPVEVLFFEGEPTSGAADQKDEALGGRVTLLIDGAAESYLDLGTLWAGINLLARRMQHLAP